MSEEWIISIGELLVHVTFSRLSVSRKQRERDSLEKLKVKFALYIWKIGIGEKFRTGKSNF